jgi:adenylate kinase
MDLQTFIFIGRSGCGKGTQAELLQKYLKSKDSEREIFYLETGDLFRKFVKGAGYTNKLASVIMEEGGREPDFLAISLWSNAFIENLEAKEHVFIDGTPRSLNEAKILDTAIKFYNRGKPKIVFIDVSRKWSIDRLVARGRADDIEIEDIEERLDWFDSDVKPAVDFYRESSGYNFLEINGEQTIKEVHNEIINKLEG